MYSKKIVKKLDWNKLEGRKQKAESSRQLAVNSKTEYWKILWQRPKAKG